jgi:hypothetical protein
MTMAPNETLEGYTRKNELFKIRETRELTTPELLELRELTRLAASHLVFNYPAKKGA